MFELIFHRIYMPVNLSIYLYKCIESIWGPEMKFAYICVDIVMKGNMYWFPFIYIHVYVYVNRKT